RGVRFALTPRYLLEPLRGGIAQRARFARKFTIAARPRMYDSAHEKRPTLAGRFPSRRRVRTCGDGERSGRLREAPERIESRDLRIPCGAGGDRGGLLRHRFLRRAEGADRLRAPVRAHDVSGVGAREEI